ncbi:Similar to MKP-4: Dual specificity protein phosphatase MPK-4 (Drosophila melanogaster) [Cotesia congregata]|uniref:Similar to MKP-4: Dual specificity protein phosphatase MPK-4 (Drosophila melanogaster) n=1 Tax=Cotesia congregata TaxID=51543 RepID=A0A8J2MNI4_COTCN|nr:Similar to MKP-4: Dual specificity protein phosphatase MPK-4 (Drosophila melanogaster) [Cotesia congregata]
MANNDSNELTREDFDAGPSSYDEIEPNLYLGNLTAAKDIKWLKDTKISHILTVDSCPLPRQVEQLPNINLKFIQITDMPRENILTFFEDTYQFIDNALQNDKKVLVHCYFGVSRSATLVIAYIMKKHKLTYEDAYKLVKSKRRFVGPNPGFIAQLKLYETMGFTIDNHLIKPDPQLTTVRPEPTVYRCKRCRRVVASASNLLPHFPNERQIWRYIGNKTYDGLSPKQIQKLAKIEKHKKDGTSNSTEACTKTHFIEPLAWMRDIIHNVEGKLNCPKCETKLGSFSWISGCQCPCGAKVAPAFYLVPSKVDWSNVVQNVLVTI